MKSPDEKPEAAEEDASVLAPTVILSLVLALAAVLLFGLSRC
jgi:hypothetical protein